jgi:hypothetical protein
MLDLDPTYLDCECTTPDRCLRFIIDDEPEKYPFVYVGIQRTRAGFWRRLIDGLKYAFGRQPLSNWEEVELGPEEMLKLEDVVTTYWEGMEAIPDGEAEDTEESEDAEACSGCCSCPSGGDCNSKLN